MRTRPTPTLHVLYTLLLSPLTLLPLPCAAQETQPPSDSLVASEPTPTPAPPRAAELAFIYDAIPERVLWLNAYLIPNFAGLELSESADPGAHAELTHELVHLQPVIEQALAFELRDLEPFPPPRWTNAKDPDAHLRHPIVHVQNISRLLIADASRAYEAKDPNAALQRLAAAVRFARSLLAQPARAAQDSGLSLLSVASQKLSAMIAADPALMRSADPASRQAATDAYAGLDPHDPGSLITSWESEAREALTYCREQFTTARGPEQYAAYLTDFGAHAQSVAAFPRSFNAFQQEFPAEAKTLRDMLPDLIPIKEHASYAAAMTPAQISAALNDAESLIPPIATALRTNDLDALIRALQTVTEDQTQLARVVCGGAGLTLELALTTRHIVADAMHNLDTLKPE